MPPLRSMHNFFTFFSTSPLSGVFLVSVSFLSFSNFSCIFSSLRKEVWLTSDHLHLRHLTFLPSNLSSNAFIATDVFTSRVYLHAGSKSMLFHQILFLLLKNFFLKQSRNKACVSLPYHHLIFNHIGSISLVKAISQSSFVVLVCFNWLVFNCDLQ